MTALVDPEGPALPDGRELYLPSRGEVFVRDVPGPPGAPVLFLLHGWTVTADLNWFPVVEDLARHYRLVMFDHRGHGRGIRTRRRFRLADCAHDVLAVADALRIDHFVPVGYSMGGTIAMLLAREVPHRVPGMVLAATAAVFRVSPRNHVEFPLLSSVSVAARSAPEQLVRPVFDRIVVSRTRDRDLHPWIIEQIMSGDPRMVLEAGSALGRFDARPWAGRLRLPTSIIVVENDEVVPTERQHALAELLPHAHLRVLDGGHDIVVRHPDRFTPALLEAAHGVTAVTR